MLRYEGKSLPPRQGVRSSRLLGRPAMLRMLFVVANEDPHPRSAVLTSPGMLSLVPATHDTDGLFSGDSTSGQYLPHGRTVRARVRSAVSVSVSVSVSVAVSVAVAAGLVVRLVPAARCLGLRLGQAGVPHSHCARMRGVRVCVCGGWVGGWGAVLCAVCGACCVMHGQHRPWAQQGLTRPAGNGASRRSTRRNLSTNRPVPVHTTRH